MYKDGKTWIIDPNVLRKKHNGAEIQREFGQPGTERVDNNEGPEGSGAMASSSGDLKYQRDSAPLLLLGYLVGPFGILVTYEGRRNKFWMLTGIISGVASMIFLWLWKTIISRIEVGSISNLFLTAVVSFVILAAVITWVRAVLLIGRHRAILVPNMPSWIRKPWATGALGLIVPGLGLFIAGYVKRAAGALFMVGISLLSVFILWNAGWIWGWNHWSGYEIIPSNALEYLFLALIAVVALGALTWIVQALDGARLAGGRPTKRGPNRGDLIAVALLAAIIAFSVMFEPAFVAKALDRIAVSKNEEGYKVIPIFVAHAAMRLDPSQPEYMLHAAAFYDDLGQQQTARMFREELYERWRPCVSELKRYGLYRGESVPSPVPGGEVALDGTKAGGRKERMSTWDQIKAIYGAITVQSESETTTAKKSRPTED